MSKKIFSEIKGKHLFIIKSIWTNIHTENKLQHLIPQKTDSSNSKNKTVVTHLCLQNPVQLQINVGKVGRPYWKWPDSDFNKVFGTFAKHREIPRPFNLRLLPAEQQPALGSTSRSIKPPIKLTHTHTHNDFQRM